MLRAPWLVAALVVVAGAGWIAPVPVSACTPPSGVIWFDDPAMTGGSIQTPTEGALYPVNSQVTCTAIAPTDQDRRYDYGTGQTTYPYDTFNKADAFTWSAVDSRGHAIGSFPNGNTGATVVWQAPEWVPPFSWFYERDGEVIIRCTMKDDAEITDGGEGSRDDPNDVVRAVTITVFDVTIGQCDNQWLPTKDGTTGISAFITPESVTGTIEFTLYDVSDEPGYCMNAGEEEDEDFKFEDQEGFTISGGNVATTTTQVNSAIVRVTCYDYGAYGKMLAVATIRGVPYLARSGEALFVTIPRDEDGNRIADGWAHNEGAATDDAETNPPGDGTPGDGFTRYQKYRGFLVQGQYMRLDPTQKVCFARDFSAIGTLGSFASPGMPTGYILGAGETRDDRVDFNHKTAPGVPVYAAIMVYQGLPEGTLGQCTGPIWAANTWVRIDPWQIQSLIDDPQENPHNHTFAELRDWVLAHELGHTVLWHQGGADHGHHTGATDDDCVMYRPADSSREQYPTTFTLGNPACRILWKVRQ